MLGREDFLLFGPNGGVPAIDLAARVQQSLHDTWIDHRGAEVADAGVGCWNQVGARLAVSADALMRSGIEEDATPRDKTGVDQLLVAVFHAEQDRAVLNLPADCLQGLRHVQRGSGRHDDRTLHVVLRVPDPVLDLVEVGLDVGLDGLVRNAVLRLDHHVGLVGVIGDRLDLLLLDHRHLPLVENGEIVRDVWEVPCDGHVDKSKTTIGNLDGLKGNRVGSDSIDPEPAGVDVLPVLIR